MSIATQITRINTAKAGIKEVVNQDFEIIEDETITYYPEKIAETIEEYKKYIPKNTVEGTELDINDAAPISGKIAVKGNTYQKSRILPEGYTQVDYIQSHGREYIDTGINADSNLRTIIDMTYDEPTGSNQNVGAINIGNNQLRYHILPQNGYFKIYVQNTTYAVNTIAIDTNRHLYDIDVPNRTIKVDENEYNINNQDFNTQLNFWLFGRNSDSTIYKSKNTLYKCKMYVSGVLVRDFIPCYRNSDNEVGLYDLANDVFYTNDGNDAFTYGSVVDIPYPEYPQTIQVVTGNNVIKNSNNNGTVDVYNLNLGNIELCKIGDYQDILFKNIVGDENYNAELEEGAWYKKNWIEKDILNGTDTNLDINTASTNTTRVYFRNTQQNASKPLAYANQYSNCLIFASINSQDKEGFYAGANKVTVVRMRKSLIGTDVQSVNNYLAQNNIITYFVMAQPTYTKITDTTLISQLEALNKARWFKGVNHWWTETNNLEPVLKGTYRQAVESEVEG